MSLENPFSGDPILGEAWELGYLAGFSEPETDHFAPLSSDGLDAYLQGQQAGRDDRRQLPPDRGGGLDISLEGLLTVAEEGGLHVMGHKFFEMIFGEIGGLIPLVINALQIPTDTPIRPLDPDWSGPVDQSGDLYVAVCSRTDHGPLEGVTPEGYWAGPGRQFFSDALADKQRHSHAEAGVARCSVPEGVCGLIWPGTGR